MTCTRQFKYEKTTETKTRKPRSLPGLFDTLLQRILGGSDAWSEFLFERPNIQFLRPRRAMLVVQGKERIGYGANVECAIFAL